NVDSADYSAYELTLGHRLFHGWEMRASYTWSKAEGQAEDFLSISGDDPSSFSAEQGFLSFDQRHRLKFQAVTYLPHRLVLGGLISWASGTPYSVIHTVPDDLDKVGSVVVRHLYPTGQRNDQRNGSIWRFDARIEKTFSFGKWDAGGFLIV